MSTSYEAAGQITAVNDVQTFESGFAKREFVLTTADDYPQKLKFELIKDKVDKVTPQNKGQNATVHFNVRGSEYNGRHFVNLQAWRVVFGEAVAKQEPPAGAEPGAQAGKGDDAIPF